jgi:hypothetical protein
MTFTFFMNAESAAVVRIHKVEDPEEKNPIWENYGRESTGNWQTGKVPLEYVAGQEHFVVRTILG